eukprot:gnl/TRDRNA2_/TRDRNA2_186758_c0_seq1.p1 gnl/TRDRNA2_/TRDRNA2_186758_c0~~gnl/TRDRNA2_/TRDRNA2_186758_c0_seq1.p1  ORF type:complete len:330 (+),score=120.45 gnl/TRDRNA2_/TRDRNA2_186758_c0_seq1:61-1050(+)
MVNGCFAVKLVLSLAFVGSTVHGLKVSAEEGVWGKPDLAVINTALASVLKQKHLSPNQRKMAEHVAASVKRDVEDLVSDTSLTEEQKRSKVKDALKEIGDLQDVLEKLPKPSNHTAALQSRLDVMEKELAKKKSELAREEDEIKLLNLEKQLDEKKMQLMHLEEQKEKYDAREKLTAKKAVAKDVKHKAMTAKLASMAKSLAASTSTHAVKGVAKTAKKSKIAAISAMLERRAGELKASISSMDAAYKKIAAKIDTMSKKSSKPQVLKMLLKKEHREYAKARAVQASELSEITAGLQGIKNGDVKALDRIIARMKGEMQTDKAHTNFLH